MSYNNQFEIYGADNGGYTDYSSGGVSDSQIFAANIDTMNRNLAMLYDDYAARRQQKYRIQLMDKENSYNSPINQRRRLEAAGLNYALLQGGSGAGATISTSSAKSPAPGGLNTGAVQFGNIASQMAEIGLMESQMRKNDADAEKAESDVDRNISLNQLTDAQRNVQQSLVDLNVSQKEAIDLDNDFKKLTKTAMEQDYDIVTGVSTNGELTVTKVKGYALDYVNKALKLCGESIERGAQIANVEAFIQSVADSYALASAILVEQQGKALAASVDAYVKANSQDAKVFSEWWNNTVGTVLGSGKDLVDIILGGTKVKAISRGPSRSVVGRAGFSSKKSGKK